MQSDKCKLLIYLAISILQFALLTASCGRAGQAAAPVLHAVALPDLSRVEESVQDQLRERYAALTTKRNDPTTPAADVGTEFGDMGKLLMPAEFRYSAERAPVTGM